MAKKKCKTSTSPENVEIDTIQTKATTFKFLNNDVPEFLKKLEKLRKRSEKVNFNIG